MYKKGELLYVCKKSKNWLYDIYGELSDGVYVLYVDSYEGNEDLSHHGSPIYENFIQCKYLDSHDKCDFGSTEYTWISVDKYMKELQNKLNEIKKIVI